MDNIGTVCIFGWGGRRCLTVFLTGIYLPFFWCWFPFLSGCLLGQGGGCNQVGE
jgi:hypothetical protein